jgi:tetratricopeptide (TPR) repeat protein
VLVALTYRRSEAYADPVTLWRQVVERLPLNVRGYSSLAQSLLKERPPRTAEAIPLLRRALALDSTHLASLRSLAAIDVSLGRLDEAKLLLEREVAVDPGYLDGAVRLGMVLVALGDAQRAIPYLAHAPVDLLAEDDPSGKTLIALGTTLSALAQWSDATIVYHRILELTPRQTSVEEFLGDALLHQNRAADAIPPLEDAAQRAPTAFGLSLLSLAYAHVGRVDEAIRMAAAVMKAGADDPLVYDFAGQAMLVARRPTEAGLLFRRALVLDPNDAQARRGMSEIEAPKTP